MTNFEQQENAPLSVSAAMARAKGALEQVTVKLVGEISELSIKPGYKAAYFTVKDQSASLPCMMWNNRYAASGVQLTVGQLVELTGRFTLYAAKGRMNFDVFSIALAGEGNLRLQVANLAKKLEAEGLMNPARKRLLPVFPDVVGVVTSPRGAVIHDILRTMRRRFPLARIVFAGVPVEGAQASQALIAGMRCVVEAGAELVIMGRGGGSFEDYMPFNDEQLARAIAACPVPVVTGIGHEPDTTIADMVSDVRASTPTAAAEAVTPARESLDELFAAREAALLAAIERKLDRAALQLEHYANRPIFSDAQMLLANQAQMLDFASDRLMRAIPDNLARDGQALDHMAQRLARLMPEQLERHDASMARFQERLEYALSHAGDAQRVQLNRFTERMSLRAASLLTPFDQELSLGAARLHDLSPLTVLSRGYAVARTQDGEVIRDVDRVSVGQDVRVMVANGELDCNVVAIRHIDTAITTLEDE